MKRAGRLGNVLLLPSYYYLCGREKAGDGLLLPVWAKEKAGLLHDMCGLQRGRRGITMSCYYLCVIQKARAGRFTMSGYIESREVSMMSCH